MSWIWLVGLAIGIGLALKWIHIYISLLHKTLQILWGLGCLGHRDMGSALAGGSFALGSYGYVRRASTPGLFTLGGSFVYSLCPYFSSTRILGVVSLEKLS